MPAFPAPRVRRTAQNTQFTYNISRRVHDVQTYPIRSPQGAKILIYGHDNGVTLVWRGGKHFKPAKKLSGKDKQNGSVDDSVMIIDSDEDDAAAQTSAKFEDKPQFEDEIEETPYPEVVQTLDLTLGTAVLHVAVLPLTPKPAKEASPALLKGNMVFAVSCVTNDVYLVTVPLTPPSPESKTRPELSKDLLAGMAGSGAWGESLVLLGGQTTLSQGIAIGLVAPKSSDKGGRSRVVVAAHSREASGVLRLWDIPLDTKVKTSDGVEPFQTEYLQSPLTSLYFNPTHTTQLLATSSPHGVRIFDFAQPSLPPDPEASGPFPSQGSWLLTLYQPFARSTAGRKPILDAAWIAHGRAVFVLLADGMWGIWDIDGVAPSSAGSLVSNKLKSGVKGAALTQFSVSGYVEGTSSLRSVASQQPWESNSGEFAPMTPGTRRQVTSSLGSAAAPDRLAAMHGGIKAVALPSPGNAVQDECLALWMGGLEHVCVIPGVSAFWGSQLRKSAGGSDVFGAQLTRMIKLHDLSTGLLGERCCGVDVLTGGGKGRNGEAQDTGLPADFLVHGETRLLVVRQDEDGIGKQLGASSGRGKRLFTGQSNAIIVHGRQPEARKVNFNLSTIKPGSLRIRPSLNGDEDSHNHQAIQTKALPPRSHVNFGFGDTLDEAADDTLDDSTRNVEAEMLDIMEIEKAVDGMDDQRRGYRKGVFFEED